MCERRSSRSHFATSQNFCEGYGVQYEDETRSFHIHRMWNSLVLYIIIFVTIPQWQFCHLFSLKKHHRESKPETITLRSTVWGRNSFISHLTDVKFTRVVHNNTYNETSMTVLSFIEFEKTPPGVQTGNDYAPIYALASIRIRYVKLFINTQNW